MEHIELINKLLMDYQLTGSQIGEALGVSYMTVYRWRKADKIRPVNIVRLKKLIEQMEAGKGISAGPLTHFDTRELVKELKSRGWRVTLTAK